MKEIFPFLQTFIRHFQNNVNAFGSFHSATMTFNCEGSGLNFKDKVMEVSGNTAEGFLESLATKKIPLTANHIKGIKSVKYHNAAELLRYLEVLQKGESQIMQYMNPMNIKKMMDEDAEEKPRDPHEAEKAQFAAMNPFEQKKRLNELIDPDFYLAKLGANMAANARHYWSMLWIGEGHGMQANKQILEAFTKPIPMVKDEKGRPVGRAKGRDSKPMTGGIISEAVEAFTNDMNTKSKAAEVPYLAYIKPETVTLEINRGIIPQSIIIWDKNGPVSGAEPVKADD